HVTGAVAMLFTAQFLLFKEALVDATWEKLNLREVHPIFLILNNLRAKYWLIATSAVFIISCLIGRWSIENILACSIETQAQAVMPGLGIGIETCAEVYVPA
ncbi:hypothetical protein ACJX0J_026477, partial [Zea mays]